MKQARTGAREANRVEIIIHYGAFREVEAKTTTYNIVTFVLSLMVKDKLLLRLVTPHQPMQHVGTRAD